MCSVPNTRLSNLEGGQVTVVSLITTAQLPDQIEAVELHERFQHSQE
jgi:hypothetical protein